MVSLNGWKKKAKKNTLKGSARKREPEENGENENNNKIKRNIFYGM